MTHRPSLDPAVAEVRRAVRAHLDGLASTGEATPGATPEATVVVAVSGGADSLALLAAVAFEASKRGIRAVAVAVDHGLQAGSADAAASAVAMAASRGLEARVVAVSVPRDTDGPEAAARSARYRGLAAVAAEIGAAAVLTGHTLDDQAETVLLGLARGSGATSLQGMAATAVVEGAPLGRPLLGIRRAVTRAACAAEGLAPWDDPHNDDPRYARVRVRHRVRPVLETELGPGIAEALARTAEQLREDAAAFDEMIAETIEDIVEHAEAGISVSVAALAANPAAVRHRIVRLVVASEFGASLSRAQTLEVARLVTDWSGQGPVDLPGCRARRIGGRLEFTAS